MEFNDLCNKPGCGTQLTNVCAMLYKLLKNSALTRPCMEQIVILSLDDIFVPNALNDQIYTTWPDYESPMKALCCIMFLVYLFRRGNKVQELIASYTVYDDLLAKSHKGIEFYKKLQQGLQKLFSRMQGVVEMNQEERINKMERFRPKPGRCTD